MNLARRFATATAIVLLAVSGSIPALRAEDTGAKMQMAVTAGDLELSGAFARATLPNAPVGGVYFTIVNKGAADDVLLSATSPVATSIDMHDMKMSGDVMQMSTLPNGIPIPAGQTVTLNPDGLHVMLNGLARPLVKGTMVPVSLTFAKAGTVTVQVMVEDYAAKGPDDGMAGMDMSGMSGMSSMEHGNGMGMAGDTSGMSDRDAIAAMQKAMFDKPDAPLQMGPIVVAGEYAISDWAQGPMGGRALLRKTDKGWGIHLCSGDSLKDPVALAKIGVPQDVAQQLAHDSPLPRPVSIQRSSNSMLRSMASR